MTGKDLLNIALSEGVKVKENHEDLMQEFDKALSEDRVYFIPTGNKTIGFCTYEMREKGLLINKCVIYKRFRTRFSLIALRHHFRKMFKNTQFYWRSKRRNNRLCYVR
jgi:hypothetical protein